VAFALVAPLLLLGSGQTPHGATAVTFESGELMPRNAAEGATEQELDRQSTGTWILRQKLLLGRSHRAIAKSVGVSAGVVSLASTRATAASLNWEQIESLDDCALESRLYPSVALASERAEPDCAWIHGERHRPGVTLELLHHEYLEQHAGGLKYTAFCERYRAWLRRRGLVMRQVHLAGDKLFVDYSARRPTSLTLTRAK
jgi:hypothetical protein